MTVAEADPILAPAPDVRWPKEADFIISAIEAGGYGGPDEREVPRSVYRVTALLKLFSDDPDWPGWPLYTREVSVRALGFVTPHCVPLSHGGSVELATPSGKIVRAGCTILRCREAAPGWFEGAIYFNREQMDFAPEAMTRRREAQKG